MPTEIDARLTPAQRLTRGLAHTAAGPVEMTRGTAGLVAQAIGATATGLRDQYRKSKARKELRTELAAAGDLVAREFSGVRDVVKDQLADVGSERSGGVRARRLLLAGAGVAALAGGAALFSKARRSRRPEPSTMPPSVSVEPRP